MRDELGRKILKEFAAMRTKTCNYLTWDYEDKKEKDTKMCIIKRKFKFEDYKYCFEATQLENKINQLKNNLI